MKTLSVKISESLFAEIASAAEVRKVPKSEIVRERLAGKSPNAEASKSSLWSRMEDLVIDEDALPTDLSSNQVHMKGYGKKRSD
jgi:hypothetical protein